MQPPCRARFAWSHSEAGLEAAHLLEGFSMRRDSLLLGVAAAAAFLTACPPTYPKCNSDEDCKSHNEVCYQGQCVECATNANCKEGFECQANKCVPKTECAPDRPCGPGKNCQGGACVP